jgi:hypothetical protein
MFHATMGNFYFFQSYPSERAEAVVCIGQFYSGDDISKKNASLEYTVSNQGDIIPAKEARPKHDIRSTTPDRFDKFSDILWTMLAISIERDDDVGMPGIAKVFKACLESSSLAAIDDVVEHFGAGFFGYGGRGILASVVHYENISIAMRT